MSEEMLQCAEEIFFERYFDCGTDKETALANFEASLKVYFRSFHECAALSEKIEDGEVVDIPSAVLSLQCVIFAYKYANYFKRSLGDETPVLSIPAIEIAGKTKDQLAKEGTALTASSKECLNLLNLEKGKYLLFAAMQA